MTYFKENVIDCSEILVSKMKGKKRVKSFSKHSKIFKLAIERKEKESKIEK